MRLMSASEPDEMGTNVIEAVVIKVAENRRH